MILVDTNLLLYAYGPSFEQHERARRWLEDVLSGPEPVRLSWIVILAFIRIGTNPSAFQSPPPPMTEVVSTVFAWLQQPSVAILEPGERHWQILSGLLEASQVRSRMVIDAHLAALALEHGAVLCTHDKDFTRFPGVRVYYPLD